MNATINFECSKADYQLIHKIVNRVMKFKINGYDRVTCDMDLIACHANGNPLDLQRLLDADDFNFCHDVLGIRQHINRETGKLENCFVPRFTLSAVA